MNVSTQTQKQLDEALRKVVAHYASMSEALVLSDLYIQFHPQTGELTICDDDDRVVCQTAITDWKDSVPEACEQMPVLLQDYLASRRELVETIHLLRPFSFVMVDADHETIADLYLVDDDTVLLPGNLMEGLEEDLDAFLHQLMEDE